MNQIISILLLSLFLYSSQNLGNQLAQCAIDQIGKPYRTGGLGPDKFDDFGLVYYCMKQLNLQCSIDRRSQANQGKKISTLTPGDVLYAYDKKDYLLGAIIYVGNSKVVYTTSYLNKGVIMSSLNNLNYDLHYDYRRNW